MSTQSLAPAQVQEVAFRLPGPLCDLHNLHQSVWSVVRLSRDQQRSFIFSFAEYRNMIGIIVRSGNLPEHLQARARLLASPADTGEYWFALRANPVARHVELSGKTVTRALTGGDDLVDWLYRQGERHGFQPRSASLSLARRCRRCTPSQGAPYTINDVLFRGSLSITSPQRLQQALINGIGRSRAFGFGMLLLASPDEPTADGR